jgi:hypothetical protein
MARRRFALTLLLVGTLLLTLALRPAVGLTHATFHDALCLCPLCLVTETMVEVSYGEYC